MLKAYNDYLKQIERVNNSKQENGDIYKIRDEYRERFFNAKSDDERAKIHAEKIETENNYHAIAMENKRKNIIIRVMCNNAKIILAREILPIICDVLQEYKNRQYGAKTETAIKERLKALTNCAVYFHSRELYIVPLKNGYSCGTENNVTITTNGTIATPIYLLDNNNRIQALSVDDFYINDNFVKNPSRHVDIMQKKYLSIQAKRDALNKDISDFNAMCVGDLKNIDFSNSFYHSYLDFYY